MRPLPLFNPRSTELLNSIGLARRFQQTVEDGVLYKDWEKFCHWLGSELRNLVPDLRDWPAPWVGPAVDNISVNIEAGASWTHNGQHVMCFCFEISPGTLYASVGLWVKQDWIYHDDLCRLIAHHLPAGFTDRDDSPSPWPEYPFWKDLLLPDFQSNGAFELRSFVQAISDAFGSLVSIRPAIDEFLARPQKQPVVAPVGKALILDLEAYDEIVEVGLILVAYNSQTSEIAGVLDSDTDLRDPGPGVKLPPKFDPKMVRGRKLDRDRIDSFIASADVIISHNNAFDRPRLKKLFPASEALRWLCSMNGLPWSDLGFAERGLEFLCRRHGIRNRDPHRALPDAEALLHLLAQKHGTLSYFSMLLNSQAAPTGKAQAAAATKRGR